MAVIDVHNHYYPPEYLAELPKGSVLKVTTDADGNPCIHYPGDYNILVPGHRDLQYRLQVMDQHKIDTHLLTFTTPGTHVESPETAVRFARIVNDAFAAAVRASKGRFAALATLPLNDPKASVAEFDRACDKLGMPGAMLFSNVNGVALADERYWPLYERANERGAILYIHPIHPVGVEAMLDYWLMPLVGFLMDTTLAAANLVFTGIPESYPRIRWVLGHLGGAIPYLAERLDRGYHAFRDCRVHISKPPSEYLKQHFYYDTVNFDPHAIALAVQFAGADHILAGSDYPHQIGSIPQMLAAIRALDMPEAGKNAILYANAAKLLGLTQ